MLATRVIPCLDVKDGRVVKGVHFVNLRDAGDPVEAAEAYDRAGADELTLLDITASHQSRDTMLSWVTSVAQKIHIPFTVGGGIRTVEDYRRVLRAGADKVSINTAAFERPELVTQAAELFGRQCVVVAIDARRRVGGPGWTLTTHGGRNDRNVDAVAWAQEVCRLGAGEILLTSMDADGTRAGYDIELLEAVHRVIDVPLIASGGAGRLEHFSEAILKGHADAVLAASLFHDKEMEIRDLKRYLKACGICVRP